MTKLKEGMPAINFTFETPWTRDNELFQVIEGKTTILMFYRFYGCRLCLLELTKLMHHYEKFINKNAQVLMVLQTEAEVIQEDTKREDIPLTIVCDPTHQLFQLYQVYPSTEIIDKQFFETYRDVIQNRRTTFIYPNTNKESELIDEEAMKKFYEAMDLGLNTVKNNEKEHPGQLPATFIIDDKGIISYVHYGKHAADVPSVEELMNLL